MPSCGQKRANGEVDLPMKPLNCHAEDLDWAVVRVIGRAATNVSWAVSSRTDLGCDNCITGILSGSGDNKSFELTATEAMSLAGWSHTKLPMESRPDSLPYFYAYTSDG